jgi:hypothetical protein
MTRKSTKCLRRLPRSGLTLIEVTAGIMLLSTLLVASIVAFHAHAQQIQRASLAAAAVKAADDLLSRWFNLAINVPSQGQGVIAGDHPLEWRTSIVGSGQNDVLTWQIVRLQITDTESSPDATPLVEVDVVIPGAPIP